LNKWLLVNYAGYPFTSSSLMPDNGLANLAGVIITHGGEVEILDYGTVSTVCRMTSPELQNRLTRAWNTLRAPEQGALASLKKLAALARLPGAEKERRRLQDAMVNGIGDELVARIKSRSIQAVGFKLWNGDGLAGSAALAARLRRDCPGLRIFGGGPHVDLFLDRLMPRYPAFDALIYGEGEETLRHLVEKGGTPAAFGEIPNLIYRSAGGIKLTAEKMVEDLDQLPMPIYDPAVYPAMAGDEKIKIIVIDESRGCRNQCAFCIHPVKSHRHVRTKSIDRLLREVRRLRDTYGFHAFRFAGSCTPYSLLNAFAAEVVRQDLHLQYASFAHIHHSNEADFDLIRRSGCVALFFGIESGSQRILDRLNKQIRTGEIRDALQRAHQAKLFTVGSIIFPAPGDNRETEEETFALLRESPLGSITLQPPIVMPRTRWFEDPAAYGFKFPDKERYLDVGMTWKVKLQLPPRFWDPLPVTLNGQSYRQMLDRTSAFSKRIATLGIPTSISDENYLMSQLAGLDPMVFRDRSLGAFYSGNTPVIADLVRGINAGAGSR
jgi:hypothetical protein